MPKIFIKTKIKAKKNIVFDLSRSIDLHKISTSHTNEEAIKGVTSGLIEKDESVTWKAKHFCIYQTLTSTITEFNKPNYFVDEMEEGIFKKFKHEHIFEEQTGITIMTDIFDYESPFGFLGKIADKVFLANYMRRLLQKRNEIIKEFAESDRWKEILSAV